MKILIISIFSLAFVLALVTACGHNPTAPSTFTGGVFTATATNTGTIFTSTATNTATATATVTPTATVTNTGTIFTSTATNTATVTPTNSPTGTFTMTPTNTATNTVTSTPTNTPTPQWTVSTLASGFGRENYSISIDSNGTLYVPDSDSDGNVAVITSAGSVSTLSLSLANRYPQGVAGSLATTLYVGNGNCIYAVNPQGTPTQMSISGVSLSSVNNLAMNSAGTTLYAADSTNDAIYTVNLSTYAGATFASLPAQPLGICLDSSGNVYTCYNNYAVEYTSGGSGPTTLSTTTISDMRGIAADNSGNVYIPTAPNNDQVFKISGGVVSVFAGTGTQGSADGPAVSTAEFEQPVAITIDHSGNFWVSDDNTNAVREISP